METVMSKLVPYYAFTVMREQNFSGFRYLGETDFAGALERRGPGDILVVEGKAVDFLLSMFEDTRNHDRLFLFEIEDSDAPDGGAWCVSILPHDASEMSAKQLYEECVPKNQHFMKHILITVYSAAEGLHIFRKHKVH